MGLIVFLCRKEDATRV